MITGRSSNSHPFTYDDPKEDRPLATRVIVIRHGQSNFNTRRIIQGRCDESVLTDLGQQQAARAGKALQGLSLAALYCSPLQRAKQTAEIVASQLDGAPTPTPNDLLREVNLPLWEKMSVAEVQEKFADDYAVWKRSPDKFSMALPEGDYFPVLELREQAKAFWEATLANHAGETIAIVGHNGINRCLISTALGIEAERYQSLLQNNCAISVLNFKGGYRDPVQLESMNLTAHLAGLEGATPVPEMKSGDRGPQFVLVRHGETEWNRKGQFQGQIDIPLNENGLAQAAKAGNFLKNVSLDMAFSSSMSRPKATAEGILKEHPPLELILLDGMKEISHGLWEGKFESEIEAGYPGLLEQWQTKPETVQMPEGENLQDVWDRVETTWRHIVETVAAKQEEVGKPLRALVVAHDAVNKALLCQVTGLGPENFWNFKQGNGCVSVISYPHGPDGLPMLQTMNITHHLSGDILDKTAAGAL